MTIKKSIFDGYHEKNLFKHLNLMWEDKFNIYPQLPFSKIFDIETLNINENEMNFLYKTNIDYTVCDKKEDKPVMCIEFDGWSHGYNRGGEYIQLTEDKLRKKKLELKLKISIEHHFPFYIIAYKEKEYIDEKIHLTVLDGIIGETIAKREFRDKINEYLEDSKEVLDSMSEYERHEYIQDLVTSTEIELELTWNPISKKAAEIMENLSNRGIISKMFYKPLSKPELPEVKNFFDTEGLENRLKAFKDRKWRGCEVSFQTPKGKVTQQSWVRNFEGMQASPLIIVQNIAELLALNKAAIINGIKI